MNELRLRKGFRLLLPKGVREALRVKSGDKIKLEVAGRGILVLTRAPQKARSKKT